MINGRIFVAGTGRCGTSRLTQLLGTHHRIYSVENETRFIIDPDGLQDLVEILTLRYTAYHSDQALKRFDFLMRKTLVGQTETAFKTWRLDEQLGRDNYYSSLNCFLSSLIDYDFYEWVSYDTDYNPTETYWPHQQKQCRRVVGKYFSSRKELIALCKEFIDRLFGAAANSHNKDIWCEKTPLNLLSMDFLWEMFPDAFIIHIKRDPRAVAYSLTQQHWAPDDIESAIKLLIPIYERWGRFRETFRFSGKRFVEIKSEDFFSNCRTQSENLLNQLGIEIAAVEMGDITKDRIDSWRTKISPEELDLCNRFLAPYIRLMGY